MAFFKRAIERDPLAIPTGPSPEQEAEWQRRQALAPTWRDELLPPPPDPEQKKRLARILEDARKYKPTSGHPSGFEPPNNTFKDLGYDPTIIPERKIYPNIQEMADEEKKEEDKS
jgi:hypothetical protein